MPIRPGLLLFSLGWLWCSTATAGLTPEQQAFVGEMVEEHGFEAAYVEGILRAARHDEKIIEAITRPAEGLPWHRYRKIFMRDDRIAAGIEYWHDNREAMEAAQSAYGVPPQLITAIIGVETRYGTFTGKHRVVDALKTLGFGYPKRSAFFRKELGEFLLMTREEDMDPLQPKGSYAGAMGKPQFISSSFRAYAIDFDGDGRRDLWGSDSDAIGSVANYFHRHGWKSGEPVTTPLSGNPSALADLSSGGRKPDRTVDDIRQAGGILENQAIGDEREVIVIQLEQPDKDEFWAGFENFYVITRYNHSNLYAMAVYQLSEAIREGYDAKYGARGS